METVSTINDLKYFNDSLISSRNQTKSNNSNSSRFINIVFADLKGGMEGYTKYKGYDTKTRLVAAAIYAIAASAQAAITTSNNPNSEALKAFKLCQNGGHVLFNQVVSVYIGTTTGKSLKEDYPYFNNVKIYLPAEYQECENVGEVHNVAMNQLLIQENVTLTDVQQEMSRQDIALALINTEDFTSEFYEYLEQGSSYDLSYNSNFCSQQEKKVLQLFLDLLKSYPENMEDVNYVINGYIKIIEQDNELSSDEKTAIYIAMSVAAYSADLWIQVLNRPFDEDIRVTNDTVDISSQVSDEIITVTANN
jgi:hypothetical protein